MAKLSQVLRDKKREKMIQKYAARRAELRQVLQDQKASPDDKFEAMAKLSKLPRNSCITRLTRRCEITGRSKAVYRKFGLCRVQLRDLALRGDLPGVIKASW